MVKEYARVIDIFMIDFKFSQPDLAIIAAIGRLLARHVYACTR